MAERQARRARRAVGTQAGVVSVSEIQRSRLLAAAVGALDEFGYDEGSVARITARARVSRRTFYELFGNRKECLLAVLDGAVEQVEGEIAAAGAVDAPWRERVRTGLWVILSVFDREPALARVCVIQTQRGSQDVLARRQQILDRLARIVDEGSGRVAGSDEPVSLTAEGVVGAVLQILSARLSDREHDGGLRELFGELMSLIVLPFAGSQAARREQARALPASIAAPATAGESLAVTQEYFDRLAQLPMRLTYRTARVLQDVGAHPGSSNRQIGGRVGISDQGQISKLLSRLERLGLLANKAAEAPARGEPNRWSLTATGVQVASTVDVSVLRPRAKGTVA